MSNSPAISKSDSAPDAAKPTSPVRQGIARIGEPAAHWIDYLGAIAHLWWDALHWLYQSLVLRRVRFGRPAFYAQIVRVGVKSIGVICLVSGCIGLILALQMAPPLNEFGQTDKVANIVAIAIFRELGPLISAVVLVGFAGAAVAAELGTMVVGEEIEALEAHALNPVRFLVLPRVLATTICMVVLCVFGEIVAIAAASIGSFLFLDIPFRMYYENTIDQLKIVDVMTGLWKSGVFGLIMGLIACYQGLTVTGGALGVGRATTNTVVHSVIAIIFADLIFTAIFYALGWT